MNIPTTIAMIMILVVSSSPSHAQTATSKQWVPATYHGLVVGRSTKGDVIKALGEPKWSGKEQDTGVPLMSYLVSDPVPGILMIYLKNNIVDGMTLLPSSKYSRKEITRNLGSGYLVVRDDTDECLDEGGTAPIYESATGSIVYLEYRSRGIAVILHDNEAKAIGFVHKPYGPTLSRCAGLIR